MSLFTKLACAFVVAITVYCIYLSLALGQLRKETAERARLDRLAIEHKSDSLYRVRFDYAIDSLKQREKQYNDSLSIARSNTAKAEERARSARKKTILAHENRSLIHLHPDSLPRF